MSSVKSPRSVSKHVGSQARQHGRKRTLPVARSMFARSNYSVSSHRSSKFAKSSGRVARSVLTATQPQATNRGLRIINEHGEDVTPLPLLDRRSAAKVTHSVLFGFGEGSDAGSDWSPRTSRTYPHTITDKRGGTAVGTGITAKRSTMLSGFSQTYAVEEEPELPPGLGPSQSVYHHSVFDDSDEELNECDLDKPVERFLTETDTINLFDLPSTCVLEDDPTAPEIEARNAAYDQLCESRIGNSRYAERGMQTINEPLKIKGTQAPMAEKKDQCESATVWDMFDEYLKLEPKEKMEEDEDLDDDGGVGAIRRPEQETAYLSNDHDGLSSRDEDENDEPMLQVSLSSLPNVQETTFIMEKALCMNTYQQRLAQYRRLPEPQLGSGSKSAHAMPSVEDHIPSAVAVVAPHLVQLWIYRCPETDGQRVNSVRWNKANPDLLAVTYGKLAIGEYPGMICCWSPKNPDYPALTYRTPSCATCCVFSSTNPALLAVGFYDGSLALYSTSQKTDEPIADCFQSTEKHMGVVWEVEFVMKDQGVGEAQREVLMTISEDGRVLQWATRQGLQNAPVMTMRRDPSFATKKESRPRKTEAFISRSAVGMHFSFLPTNSANYLVATESGSVHLCSTAHSDQYLFTYTGHLAPVYRAHWSPFTPEVLITCSADWSFRVWHVDQKSAVLIVPSASKSAVNDIQWSPRCATQLALCTDQEVEVWDLDISALDPLIVHPNVSRAAANTTLTFGEGGGTLLIGDTNGGVTVYQTESLPEAQPDHVEKLLDVVKTQLNRLLSTQEDIQEELPEVSPPAVEADS